MHRERDPEFYEYLKESDGDLLAFGDGMDLSDSDQEAPQAVCASALICISSIPS